MLGKNYLTLVNDAIFESNVTLDLLTAANFSDPPRTVMYSRFKKWINDAYVELLEDRNDWRFRVARSTMTLYPRLRLNGLQLFPVVGDVLTGENSGISFKVLAIHNNEIIEGDTEDRTTVSVEWVNPITPNRSMVFGELLTKPDGIGGKIDVGYLQGNGYYDFKFDIPYLEDILPNTLSIHPTPEGTIPQAYTNVTQGYPVHYTINEVVDVPYAINFSTIPYALTRVGPNQWQLHPQPGKEMILNFQFSKEINRMALPTDMPFGLPEEYHDYLVWKAVAEYADFQRDTSVWARAKKHLDKFDYYLFRDQVKEAKFVDCAFTGG